MTGEDKRPAVKARKAHEQASKGARRRQRSGNGALRADGRVYGTRTVTRYPGQGVSITLQIPPLRRSKHTDKKDVTTKRPGRRLLRPVLLMPLLVFVVAAAFFVNVGPGKTTDTKPTTAVSAAERTEPAYQPLVPSAEKASATKYDAKRDLVTYTTSFSGARITVSQQSLPASFGKDADAVKRAADGISAKQQIDTGSGPLFIATKDDSGDQLAVYAGKQVLVFIHADRKIDDVSWKSFIELLQAKSWKELG